MNRSFLFTVQNSLLSGNLLRSLTAMFLLSGVGWSAAETSENGFVPPPIPSLARWEEQIVRFGEQHLAATDKAIADPKADAVIGANFYDRVRLFYRLADHTKDEKWAKAADRLAVAYRDRYVLPNKGNVQPWYLAPDGLCEHFRRTGDVKSKEAALLLGQAMWASDANPLEWSIGTERSREVAHSLRALMRAEELGAPPRERMKLLVDQSLGHIDQWCGDKPNQVVPSFMAGLTMESLIQWHAKSKDPRVLPAVRKMTDWLWEHNWVPEIKAFKYYNIDTTSVSKGGSFPDADSYANTGGPRPVPDLNMFIGPAVAWLYHQEGRATDRDRADVILAGTVEGKPDGVSAAYLQGGKQYNQAFTWSFDFLRWRLGKPLATK
jgi:hypothetical protein